MNRLSKILAIAGSATIALAGAASAMPIYYDVSAAGGTGTIKDGDTKTGLFEQLNVGGAQTTTTQYDDDGVAGLSVGDTFSDRGSARVFGLIAPTLVDSEGLNDLYEMTIDWGKDATTGLGTDVTGFVDDIAITTKLNVHTTYTGGVFNFYYDPAMDSSYGGTIAYGDNTGFKNGTLIMTVSDARGTGTNTFDLSGKFEGGRSTLTGTVTYVLDNFWFDGKDVDLGDYVALEWLLGAVDQNTDKFVQTPGAAGSGVAFTIDSDHDGSVEFNVVPEPGTMLLLGSGLLGLAGLGRRRGKKA